MAACLTVARLIFEQVVSGVHPGRCHLLPLKHSSRQAPPSLATDGSLQFTAKCGVKLRLLLQACDESGAALTSGGDKFEAAATCLADGTVALGAAVVEDNADGTYDISVCLSRTGLHLLTCHFGGCSVSGFPVHINVSGSSMAAPGDFGPCCAVASDVHVRDSHCMSLCSICIQEPPHSHIRYFAKHVSYGLFSACSPRCR